MVKSQPLIYIRNKKCGICGNNVIYYTHTKKLICDCGDIEVILSKRVLSEHFKPFDEVLKEILIKKGE